jgi:Domain of unknown function (DUF4394)
MRLARLASVCGALALTAAAAAPAHAEQGVALLSGNRITVFDAANPNAITTRPITGLGANETVRGIDLRASNGLIYALSVTTGSVANSVVRTYTIDPSTGAASLVGPTAGAIAGAGDVPTGIDVNPRGSDRIRYVNTNDENARINQDTGLLAGNDTDLTPSVTSTVIAVAYDLNLDGGTATEYAIDRNDSSLGIVGGIGGTPSANGGVVTDLSALGFTLSPTADGGFDIAPSGTFYAALTNSADNLTRLYRFTGAALPVAIGTVGDGSEEVRSLTVLADPPAPPPPPPTPTAPDTTKPVVLIALTNTSLRLGALTRGFRYEFSCNEACTARASLSIPGKVRASATLARGSATLTAAGKGRLRIRATAAGKRALKALRRSKRRRIRATLATVVTDAAGNRTTVRKRLVLRR